jgi:hypothetical protein
VEGGGEGVEGEGEGAAQRESEPRCAAMGGERGVLRWEGVGVAALCVGRDKEWIARVTSATYI